ncbi:hypothetical protein TRFO_09843 [Tritrichomonas foetus]|uniref:Protein kinase domain-containing protein n=1 Tax=Tritrichomonas foetus TaxID=1144522 RepID=A0A1J4JDE9_9EUKA|nr:hypothetical protein TRFO_09843 [Tritrichomonas foetus]|eukprot:OHS96681.1 hypothetical protein TRFO_09843 [Tritrichomonas foetus]
MFGDINFRRDFYVEERNHDDMMERDKKFQLTAFQKQKWEIIYFSKINQNLVDILKSEEMEPFITLSIENVEETNFLSLCCQSKLFLIEIDSHIEDNSENNSGDNFNKNSFKEPLNDSLKESIKECNESLNEIIRFLNEKLIYCLPEDQKKLEKIISRINMQNENHDQKFNKNENEKDHKLKININFANEKTFNNIETEMKKLHIQQSFRIFKQIQDKISFFHQNSTNSTNFNENNFSSSSLYLYSFSLSFLEFFFLTKNSFFIYLFHRNEFKRTLFKNNDFYYPEKYLNKKFTLFKFENMVEIRRLGNGQYSRCTIFLHLRTGLLFAAKIFSNENSYKIEKKFYQQIEPHPFILRCYGYIQQKNQNNILIFDWKVHGDLNHFLHNNNNNNNNENNHNNRNLIIDENLKNKIIIEIIFGIDYLHSHGYMHRDIKLDNILIDDEFKSTICDFNSVRKFEKESSDKQYTINTGTLKYMPPEKIKDGKYSFQVDIYSFGCLLYEIITGKQFSLQNEKNMTVNDIVRAISENKIPKMDTKEYGMCGKLYTLCTSDDVLGRTTMIYLRYLFQHDIFISKGADPTEMIRYLHQLEHDLEKYNIPSEERTDFQIWKKLAEEGNGRTLFYIGIMYYYGEGLKQNYLTAKEYFEKAIQANPNYPNSYNSLGMMYNNGFGVEKDRSKSSELYKKAADLGFNWGKYNYSINLFYGYGVKSNPTEALKLLEETSKSIHYAKYAIALIKYFGRNGIPVDKVSAIKYLQDAVFYQSLLAMEFLGQILFVGEEGILDKNRKEAAKLFSTVNLYSYWKLNLFFLAYMLDVGDGVEQDKEEATKMFEKVPKDFEDLQNNVSFAHIETFYFIIGYMKMYGRGVQKNEEEAIRYFHLSKVSFLPESQNELDKYYQMHPHTKNEI